MRALARAVLPERQLFIRSNGTVRVIHLSRRRQLGLAVSALVLVLAVTGSAKALLLQRQALDVRERAVQRLAAERDEMAGELGDLRHSLEHWNRHYAAITRELERKYGLLVSITESRAEAEGRREAMLTELSLLERERRQSKAGHDAADKRYRALREELTQASYLKPEPEGSLVLRPLRPTLAFGGALTLDTPAADRIVLAPVEIKIESAARLLASAMGERDQARAAKRLLQSRVSTLENRLALVQDMQDTLIDRLSAGTDKHIDELEHALALTGLDVDNLLERIGDASDSVSGLGGPFVSLPAPERLSEAAWTPRTHPEVTQAPDDQFEEVLNRMGFRLARLSALNALAERLPLAAPVEDYKVRSRFGKRRDPLTKRWAQHGGLDLGADRRAPILAPAAGTVSFAGWNGPYGRMVEIDHGYGLKTRYGHLYRIHVKRGQRVVRQQQIGIMGSSGRSTGRHLHYEVHFDGRPVDPMTFLKAGDHVFKNRQD